ncbi:MAG: glycosyltransferase family 4 protein, partial [Anaerolineae bacterium]
FILTVGKEQRDYRLLLRALSGTGIKLVVVASSPWSTSQAKMNQADDNVTVLSHIPYHQLRTLYAQARLVVVPLFGVDYAAGVNTVLEAMAMAKPLVVSRTKDITDYVTHGETGLCVSPGDVAELKERILSVWERPSALNRLGANARQAVEEKMNLDIYVNQVARIVQKTVSNHQSGGA